jgi:hypothetical protein
MHRQDFPATVIEFFILTISFLTFFFLQQFQGDHAAGGGTGQTDQQGPDHHVLASLPAGHLQVPGLQAPLSRGRAACLQEERNSVQKALGHFADYPLSYKPSTIFLLHQILYNFLFLI